MNYNYAAKNNIFPKLNLKYIIYINFKNILIKYIK